MSHAFRDAACWRAAGIAYRITVWTMTRKKQSDEGVRCKLRRLRDVLQLWFGSFYFTQGATRKVHARDVHEFVGAMPVSTLPLVVGGDANTEIKWGDEGDDGPQCYISEGKGDYMLGAFREQGLVHTAPPQAQWATQTSRPRKPEVTGRQIDGVLSKRLYGVQARIVEGSYAYMGQIMTQWSMKRW